MQTDWQIEKGLHELHRGLVALTDARQTPHEKLATAKAQLDEEWQADLLPVMQDLYWHPFRNGIDEAPEDVDDLRSWLERRYDDAAVIAILLLLLQRYSRRAYSLGGQIGLDFLGIDATFNLSDADIVAQIDAFAEALTERGTEYSLINTTINDLITALPKARIAATSTALALSAYIATRTTQRTEAIERTERPRWVAAALDETFARNGVTHLMYDVNGIGCPRYCAPLHGAVWPIGRMPAMYRLPQHPWCDCIYSPVLVDGGTVGYPPLIVNVPGLRPWNMPEEVWTGG